MESTIGLVFSWDPRSQTWAKERGPEDAAPPPAKPIDHLAVQTYFLDPANGRWQPTILGLRARQVANDLGKAYRTAAVAGLAMIEQAPRNPRLVVELEDDHRSHERSRLALRMIAGVIVLVVLIGGGAVAANTFLGPIVADANATPTQAGTTATASQRAAAPSPSATPQASTTTAAASGAAQTQAPAATAARTAATAPVRTVAPITFVTYTTRFANGVTVSYTGPNGVVQQTALDMTFRATQPGGQPAFDNLTIYLGNLGTAQALTIQADPSGTYTTSLKVTLPKGDQLLSVRFGLNGELRALGTIAVR